MSTPRETAERLRTVAELLDTNPDLPNPCVWAYGRDAVTVQWQILRDDKATQRDTLNQIRRSLGGTWRKIAGSDSFAVEQKLDNGITLQVIAQREAVCTRRVVGTREVTIPAREATPELVVVDEIVEWDCDPLTAEVPS